MAWRGRWFIVTCVVVLLWERCADYEERKGGGFIKDALWAVRDPVFTTCFTTALKSIDYAPALR
jgi:hypothetical protein